MGGWLGFGIGFEYRRGRGGGWDGTYWVVWTIPVHDVGVGFFVVLCAFGHAVVETLLLYVFIIVLVR